jgi:hypothetical protein
MAAPSHLPGREQPILGGQRSFIIFVDDNLKRSRTDDSRERA